MTDTATGVSRYDEEDDVCTGCGTLVDGDHSWCPKCAPEVYGR